MLSLIYISQQYQYYHFKNKYFFVMFLWEGVSECKPNKDYAGHGNKSKLFNCSILLGFKIQQASKSNNIAEGSE